MGYNEKKNITLIVIPAFNEQKHIADVVSKIRNLPLPVDILVVDDSSTDATAHIAKSKGAKVISLPFNMGYGASLQTGFKYATENKYEYIIHLDADGQHEPESIDSLIKGIQNGQADIVIGSRFLVNPNYPLDIPRRIGIAIFRTITSFIIKQNITDPTSGFQALNRKAFELYSNIYPVDFPDADIIILSYFAGLKIREIPVKIYPKSSGKSIHSGLKPFYYAFKMFLSIFVTLLRKKKRPDEIYLKNKVKEG